ncbi:ankyrin repeat domain-containing protein 27-like [Acanthaster planci]|uniref:Ankyrin repeat domain-containing protein 27-like n=1 Tax=Acanthaster planci TaxID=133434 RepID=A0A8B8A0J9_ACAPL|nr:ankyrin repeat domain-containing protein 27-like [Acanthaster planci]
MAEQDDLEFNPMYKCLQTRFRGEFEIAQDNCYLVCIPQTASLVGVSISLGLVQTHLLKPSPMLKDHYISTDKDNSKTISVEDGIITCLEGFRQQDTVRVLSEELGYNKNYKPFKMLIIERPLEGARKGRRGSAGLSDEFLTPRTTYAENCKFLSLFHENRAQLSNMQMKISEFNQTYMILPGYLMDTACKLRGIWEHSRLAFSETNNYIRLQSDSRLEEAITVALESYIMGGVHTKVFKAVCQQMAEDDQVLYRRVQELQGVKANQLGVKKDFCCPLPAAVVELARLDGINNPQEKLLCLKSTLDAITDEVSAYLRMNLAPGYSLPCLTSDELIPLQVLVISQAKCQYLASNLFYMEHFHWVKSDHNDVGYTLVSFKAAMEYMKNTDFTKIMGSQKLKKEMTVEELMAEYNSNFDQDPELQNASPLARSTIGNITRMMEKTTVSSDSEGHKTIYAGKPAVTKPRTSANPVPDVVPHSEKPVLGDFLSALQNDVLDCTYGKLD